MLSKKFTWSFVTALTTAGITVQGFAAPALAQTTTVAQGAASAVTQSATVFGNTPASTPVTVSIILRTQNTQALTRYIRDTTNPASSNYRRFLSTSQFAEQFGQSPETVGQIIEYFRAYGIRGQAYANNLDITLNGTAGQFDQAFTVNLQDMQYHGERFHGSRQKPQLPDALAGKILAVLGLTNYSPFSSNAKRLPASVLQQLPNGGNSASVPGGVVTPQQFAQHYKVDPLYQSGDYGQGQTIGIVTLASLVPSDPYTFWKAYNIPSTNPRRITTINVDGGAGAPSKAAGSGETALDVEQSGAVAPQANIRVYQAPNTDSGFADAFFKAITQNIVDSLSASWGESEDAINYLISTSQESPNYAQVFNEIYMEAAAQGISTFASAGDSGAYDAYADLGTTDLSVDNPADSPYITAAGGTTLPWSDVPGNVGNSRLGIPNSVVSSERAWGWDYLWPYYSNFKVSDEFTLAMTLFGGGGGGYSSIFTQPDYQNGVSGISSFSGVPYLTPIQNNTSWSFNPTPSVVTGNSNNGRAMPDVSMNADPFTGYAIYSQVFGSGGWSAVWGGTSFVAPQLNGIAALIDQKAGGRVGFWNPQIYKFAKQPNSPFTPLNTSGTSNDNLYYTGSKGTLWNPATGLGYPDVAALARDFTQSAGH